MTFQLCKLVSLQTDQHHFILSNEYMLLSYHLQLNMFDNSVFTKKLFKNFMLKMLGL